MAEHDFRSRYLMKVGITKRDELGRIEAEPGAQAVSDSAGSAGAAEALSTIGSEEEDIIVATHETAQPAPRQRATDDFRLAYIQKLTASRAFIPQLSRPKAAQTVTIFDWGTLHTSQMRWRCCARSSLTLTHTRAAFACGRVMRVWVMLQTTR